MTDWLVRPLRRIIPGPGGFDWATLVGAWLAAVYLTLALMVSGGNPLDFLPFSLLMAIPSVLKWGVSP